MKIDTNLCNESWFEMEIANIQIEMASYPYGSEEYTDLYRKMEGLVDQVMRIEDRKFYNEKLKQEYIFEFAKFSEVVLLAGAIFAIARRLIK